MRDFLKSSEFILCAGTAIVILGSVFFVVVMSVVVFENAGETPRTQICTEREAR